jgi:hypothetical protein
MTKPTASIFPSDVSVVIQGPYHPEQTPQCLESVARVLPGAEIILSVWRDAPPPDGVKAHKVVLNEDPGMIDLTGVLSPEVERRTNIVNANVNRQIVSTRNGLAAATRPYALKLRTDMALEHAGFLEYAAAFRDAPTPDGVFSERIVATNARSPRRAFAFFIQDFCSFGRLEDMRIYWNPPLVPGREALLSMPVAQRDALTLTPEQHFVLSALRRKFELPMANSLVGGPALAEICERLIASNFVCLDIRRFGAATLKPSLAWVNETGDTRYTWLWILKAGFAEYVGWCRRHCGATVDKIIDVFRDEYEAELADVPVKNSLVSHGGGLNPEGLLWLGERSHRDGRWEQAWNAYVTLARANFDHPRLTYNIGVLQVQNGELKSGIANLEAAVRKAPDFQPAYQALAEANERAGDTVAAEGWRKSLEQVKAQT